MHQKNKQTRVSTHHMDTVFVWSMFCLSIGTRSNVTGLDSDCWMCEETFDVRHADILNVVRLRMTWWIRVECAYLGIKSLEKTFCRCKSWHPVQFVETRFWVHVLVYVVLQWSHHMQYPRVLTSHSCRLFHVEEAHVDRYKWVKVSGCGNVEILF